MPRNKELTTGTKAKSNSAITKQLAKGREGKGSDGPNLIKRLRRLRTDFEKQERNYIEGIHALIGKACEVAADLSSNKEQWATFCADPWWKSAKRNTKGTDNAIRPPKAGDRKEALRHVLKWIFGNRKDPVRTASFYYRAVAPLIEEGIPPKKIPSAIATRGGLKKLAKAGDESETTEEAGDVTNEPAADEGRGDNGPAKPKPTKLPTRPSDDDDHDDTKPKLSRAKRNDDFSVVLDATVQGGDHGLFQLKLPAYIVLYGILGSLSGGRPKLTIEGITVVEDPYTP